MLSSTIMFLTFIYFFIDLLVSFQQEPSQVCKINIDGNGVHSSVPISIQISKNELRIKIKKNKNIMKLTSSYWRMDDFPIQTTIEHTVENSNPVIIIKDIEEDTNAEINFKLY